MPIKIKQKQTKIVSVVSYGDYYHNINKNLYDVLSITGLYELYNSISGEELWQATVEEEDANAALLKHPNIFRITYSAKNTDYDAVIKSGLDMLPYEKISYPFLSRLLNKKLVLKQIKYAIKKGIRYGVKLLIEIWKYIVLVSATFLGGWLALDDNFKHFIDWIKNIF
jgi:hypothetical protein